jgi:hypothetical protein
LKTTDKRCSQGEMPWEMTRKKILAPLLGLAAKGDEKAERGFGFHGEEGGRRKGSWLVEIRELGFMQMWSSPFGAVAGGVDGCWPSRGATPWKPASSLLELGPEDMPRPGWSRGGVGEEGPLSQPLARRNREGAVPWLALLPALCLLRVEENRERRNGS